MTEEPPRKPRSELTGDELRARYEERRRRVWEDLNRVEERDPRIARAGRRMLFPENS